MTTNAERQLGYTNLVGQMIHFVDFLRARGYRVFQSNLVGVLQGIEKVGLSQKEDFFYVLRANLAASDVEWSQFRDLFEEFWRHGVYETDVSDLGYPAQAEQGREDLVGEELPPEAETRKTARSDNAEAKEWLEGVGYSPLSKVEKQDLSTFDLNDVRVAQLAIKRMIAPFRLDSGRRFKRSRNSGDVDFRRVLRNSLKTGGIPAELFYKRHKRRLKRLIMIADVSGSMDRYARFVLPFILGLRGIGSKVEIYVFATALTRITTLIRHLSIDKVLERIALEVPDWSGGTRIGYSLHQFNAAESQKLNDRRAVVVILSDGWDLGAKSMLRQEMEALSKKAYCVIWLNPIANDPDYRPLCGGMKAALPYVNHFLPANSLQDLKAVGRLLFKLMIH
jgi:uncharacterized protein with von Willebrand factor type A (vWA) domain